MLMNARNHLCSVFQKLVGVFLFAQQASRSTVDFLCRIGLSVAPTTTRAYLEALGDSANETIRYLASLIPFRVMFIYDNINRTTYVWDPRTCIFVFTITIFLCWLILCSTRAGKSTQEWYCSTNARAVRKSQLHA